MVLQLKEFENFFATDGSSSLVFFYVPPDTKKAGGKGKAKAYDANGRRLFITDGTIDQFPGTCIFFLRLNVKRAITILNIHQVNPQANDCYVTVIARNNSSRCIFCPSMI